MSRTSGIKRALLVAASASILALAACNEDTFDTDSQIGSDPVLPEPQQYLFPPMHLASVVGWKNGETGHEAGLQHPRSLYVLPNGDVLVVESKAPGRRDQAAQGYRHGLDRILGRATASPCCAMPMATASPRPQASSSTI
jgi:glucose/arabinose dehydrogenase